MEKISVENPRVLITGATGFIGRALCASMEGEGWEVHALLRRVPGDKDALPLKMENLHILESGQGNINKLLECSKPDVVFHLASLFLASHTPDDTDDLVLSNILFGTKLVEAMTLLGINNFVNTGTAWQHYEGRKYCPVNLYAATKQAFEDILEFYVNSRGLKVVTLKLNDTYGPGDKRKKLLPVLVEKFLKGESIQLARGENMLDLVYIDDVCSAFIAAGKRLMHKKVRAHERFAVSSGRPVDLRHLVSVFSEVVGIDVHPQWGAFPQRGREIINPCGGGKGIPGWKPKVSLKEGIEMILRNSKIVNDRKGNFKK
jgi:nucleoside-diphosphate-sugar epimerase